MSNRFGSRLGRQPVRGRRRHLPAQRLGQAGGHLPQVVEGGQEDAPVGGQAFAQRRATGPARPARCGPAGRRRWRRTRSAMPSPASAGASATANCRSGCRWRAVGHHLGAHVDAHAHPVGQAGQQVARAATHLQHRGVGGNHPPSACARSRSMKSLAAGWRGASWRHALVIRLPGRGQRLGPAGGGGGWRRDTLARPPASSTGA